MFHVGWFTDDSEQIFIRAKKDRIFEQKSFKVAWTFRKVQDRIETNEKSPLSNKNAECQVEDQIYASNLHLTIILQLHSFLSFHRDLEMGKISKILLKSLFVSSTSAADYLVTGCNDENLDVSKENVLFDRPDSTGTSIIIYFGPLSFLQLSTLRFSDRRV